MDFPGLSWGREKRDLADRWPRNADGVPEKPAFLTRETERNNAAGMLIRNAARLRRPRYEEVRGG